MLDTHFSHRKLQSLEGELGDCSAEIARISETEQSTRNEINERAKRNLAEARRELDAADENIADGRSKLQQLENEIASHRHRIEFNENMVWSCANGSNEAGVKIESAESKLRDQNAEIESANALVEETARLLEQRNQELKQLTENVARQREAFRVCDQKLRDTQMSLSKDELRLSAITEDSRDLRERRDTTKARLRNGSDQDRGSGGPSQTIKRADCERARHHRNRTTNSGATFRAGALAGKTSCVKAEARWPISRKKLAAIDRTIAENESRHEVLRQLNEEGEGLTQGSQALLKNKEFEFGGALAAQLNVPYELVPAIEAALGRNLHALILRDAGRAAEIISHLNQHQLGQAALVLGGMEHRDRPTKDLPPSAVDWAANKVQAPEALAPLCDACLTTSRYSKSR